MKKLLLLTLLCFSINGFAFNWKKVADSTDGGSYYVDVDNIKKRNGLVYYWTLGDFFEPLRGGPLGDANSSIDKYKVDCVEEKQTLLNATFYSQPMGEGKIVQDSTHNKIIYPKPNSNGYFAMKFACDNAK